TQSGQYKKNQCRFVTPAHQVDDDERQERHSQQGQLVGRGQKLGELYGRGAPPRTCTGSRPVFVANCSESDGTSPSRRSSSIFSTRCMGKKRTAGEHGSPALSN